MLVFPPDWQMWIFFAMLGFGGVLSLIGYVSAESNINLSRRISKAYGPLFSLVFAWALLCFGHANGYTLLGFLFQ
jgi:hypothetical protein